MMKPPLGKVGAKIGTLRWLLDVFVCHWARCLSEPVRKARPWAG